MATIFTGSYSENFDTLVSSGTGPTDTTPLPSGWVFVETGTNANATYTAGTGSNNAGDTYSFGIAGETERALGGLLSGSLTPLFGTSFTNNTGNSITSLTTSYRGEQWRLGNVTLGRVADRLDFQYSLNATSLTTGTWVDVDALDFSSPVTTGSTVGSLNGNTNSTTLSTVISGLNIAAGETFWFRWQDFNVSGSDDGLAIDDFSLSSRPTPPPLTPTVAIAANPASTTEGSTISGLFTISRTGDITNPLTVNFTTGGTATSGSDYRTPDSFATNSIEIPAGQSSVTIGISANDDTIIEAVENVSVTLGTSVNYSVGSSNTATVTINDNDTAIAVSKIHQIQGSGLTFNSAFGGTQAIEGVVVGSFLGSSGLNGFYVQEEDTDWDTDFGTSEGIFVFDPTGLFSGAVGDKVRVTGLVGEFTSSATGITGSTINSSLTQLSLASTVSTKSVLNLGSSSLPSITNVTLPVADASVLERYEGMLVNVGAAVGSLTVTNNFTLSRFGQVGLSAGDRLDQYTQVNAPSVTGYADYRANLLDNYIILDDGSNTQNPAAVIHARNGQPLSATNTLRAGDTIASITGVLDQRFEGYRVQTKTPANFDSTNVRENTAPDVGGTLKVASFNLLNFFNGDGMGGGFPTSRGADSLAEYNRQLPKTVEAILGLNADVFGYNEIENDGYGSTSAVQTLVDALNAATAPGTYAFVTPPASALNASGTFGGDEITVGFIYKTSAARVAPGTSAAALTTGAFAQDDANRVQRPALAVTFEQLNNGLPTNATFTAVINHFKSKSSSAGGVGDADIGDGQGFSNGTRTRASQDLAAWLATNPTGTADSDYLIMGDLNAYRLENPITTLTDAGYTSLFGSESYSYQFQGQWGSLDHALASGSLNSQVTGAAKWHINADEPLALDYNLEFKSAVQQSSFYNVDPFASSDHDPLVVGLNLTPTNQAPTAVTFSNPVATLAENTSTTTRIQVATVNLTDDGFGTNVLSLSGTDSSFFELDGSALFLKANTSLNFEDKFSYAVTVAVDDASVGITPDASANFTLAVTNVNEAPIANNDSGFTANQSMAKLISIATLLANDTDPDANPTLSILPDGFSDVVGGTVALNGGNVVFTPGSSFSGPANFKYTLSDGSLTSQAIVMLQVGRTVNGGNGKDALTGNDGDDNFNGGSGEDMLFGNVGNDTLLGGNGDDKLFGGQGINILTGGNGADTFVLDSFAGTSTITDFTDGQDKIGLPGGLSFGQLSLLQGTGSNLNDVLVNATSNGVNYTLGILQGVSVGSLSANDFMTV
ncbi:ExeM/NucH family extracellular endonuclease [Phormidium sp. CLA17]|uniref:ExeM/NucH family extracellular endonuclease n=1 Tax=Leptolyngbya sp. Cla-17 TaxID=2803751 RepID=UPI001490D3C8|nr:ExeM/NucH family extracellular endonuclease [Leptolyngbya sp. Cla-17]MBM0743479.1 ExeM/NucH family extracellular endonuclease [Leptolyngbya sp. Cla-17]